MQINSKISFDNTSIAFEAKSTRALKKAHLLFSVLNNPFLSKLAAGATRFGLNMHLPINGIIKNTVFEIFCGGETIQESQKTVSELAKYHMGTILDYSVEGQKAESEFDATKDEILKTIEKAKGSENIPFCVFKPTGLGKALIFQKIQENNELSEEEALSFQKFKDRVDQICKRGFENDVPILIDAEESWLQDPIDQVVAEMMQQYNKQKAIIYNTYQMYRVNMLDNLKKTFHQAVMHNYFVGAKLVRGAYMEKERERAEEIGYPSPIQPTKDVTDDEFNKALVFCLDNKQRISMICGSHNEYSNYYLTLLMEKHGMNNSDPRVYFGQLYGMSDNISFNLAHAGYNVVKYVPYGPVRSVMPYLFRRAEENTSVAGQSSRELSMIKKELQRRGVV